MNDHLRASDSDRDRAAALLRDHFAAGRLTALELDERLTAALRARSLGDLRHVMAGLPEPAPVPRATRRFPPAAALERSYRRLLAFYPAQYRSVHEDEMLAVLLTGAPEDKRRPGMAEAADLLAGALRIRCQPYRTAAAGAAWRDALAVLSVILPVITLLTSAVQQAEWVLLDAAPGPFRPGVPPWVVQGYAAQVAMVALMLLALRRRRIAALAAAALLAWLVSGLPGQGVGLAIGDAYLFLAIALEIAALIASPGPHRGLQILTWEHWALITTAALSAGSGVIARTLTVRLAAIVAVAVTCAAVALASPLGRRLLLLLAIPASPLFLGPAPPVFRLAVAYLPLSPALIASTYLPPLTLLILATVTARASLRSSSLIPASCQPSTARRPKR